MPDGNTDRTAETQAGLHVVEDLLLPKQQLYTGEYRIAGLNGGIREKDPLPVLPFHLLYVASQGLCSGRTVHDRLASGNEHHILLDFHLSIKLQSLVLLPLAEDPAQICYISRAHQ